MQEFLDRDKTHATHVFHNRRPRPHTVYSFENDDERGQRMSQGCEILPTEAKVEEPPAGSKLFAWGTCENLTETTNVNWHVKVVCQESSKHWTKHSLPKRLPTGTGPASLMPSEVCKIHVICMILDGRTGTCLTVTVSPVQVNLWREYFLLYTNLPTCSAGLAQALSNVNPSIILEGVWQWLRWWPIIRAVATSVVAPGLFRESWPAMWATTVLDGLE